jgi:OOP family OmpA-OmpF porin
MRGDKKVLLAAMLGAAVMAAPAVSMAQARGETGWYLGGNIGQSKLKDGCSGLGGSGISCDDKDTAFKILGGYNINRNFAAELGYTDLGKAKASGLGLTDELKATAWELSGVGSYPVANQFSVFGRLGLYFADVKENTNFVGNFKHTNNDLTYGFGVRYDFSRELGVRGEWQRYSKVGGGDIGKSDVDVISVGAVWNFR